MWCCRRFRKNIPAGAFSKDFPRATLLRQPLNWRERRKFLSLWTRIQPKQNRRVNMNRWQTGFLARINFLLAAGLVLFCAAHVFAQTPAAPVTRQDNVKETIHGVEIVDPYRWLEDQDAKEVRDWVSAENAY